MNEAHSGIEFIVNIFKHEPRNNDVDAVLNGYIAVEVSDTGCGIDEHLQKNIFDPFFTTKEPGKGTGMGLASVYGTVKNHSGAITVTSKRAHGTTMTIYLPHEPGTIKKTTSLSPSPGTISLTKGFAKLLLVDDEKNVANATANLLKLRGYSVTICTNGSDAVAYFRDNSAEIDLVILDMVMPRMNGNVACEAILNINPTQPILLYSGHVPSHQKHINASETPVDFIAKPYHPEELFSKVEQLLKHNHRPTDI